MNKKLFLGMFAAAGMLLATSCSNDELDMVQSGNEAQVTFSLGLEGGLATRAISDGKSADKLVYAVYKLDANGTPVLQNVVGSDENNQFVKDNFKSGDNVSITLAKGQTYQVAFWAQDGDCKAYATNDLTAVEVKYQNEDGTNAVNNDELRDAFFKMVEFEVAGNKTIDVVLKRPFAQINVGVTAEDWEAAVASGIEIENSAVVIKNAANKINLLTGAVDGNEVVTYALNAIPEETLYVETDDTQEGKEAYNWLSMSYILVNDGSEDVASVDGAASTTLESLQFTFAPESGNAIEFKEGLYSVPVQRNWRTNILGKILTGDIEFNVTVDPAYDGDIIYPDGLAQELEFAATFGGTVTLTEDFTMDKGLKATADMVVNLNGKTITYTGDDVLFRVNGSTVTINGTVDGSAIVTNPTTPSENGGNGYIGFVSAGGTLNINGGDYDAQGTCTIAQVKQGTLNVYGGTFKANIDKKDTWTDANGEARYLFNCSDAQYRNGEAVVNIYGGTFYKFNPANNAAEGAGTNFCAEGYTSSKVGDNYVVVEEGTTLASTSQDLVAAFAKGGTVVLMNNIALEENIVMPDGNDVYLDMNGKTITIGKDGLDPLIDMKTGSSLVIDGNGTFDLEDNYGASLIYPRGDVTIKNGNFLRGAGASSYGSYFVGINGGKGKLIIEDGYFDGGYYKEGDCFNNCRTLLNCSWGQYIRVYGGTFVAQNPAWGDEGMSGLCPHCNPTYCQGIFLEGQTQTSTELPEGYTITEGTTADGRPTYTVTYSK